MPPDTLPEQAELLDPLTLYLREADDAPRLSADEEQELARRIRRKGRGWKQARQKFREANLLLVVSVAKRFRWAGLPLADRIQEGNLALLRAVDGFDPNLGYRFSTYAVPLIQHAIARAIKADGTVRVPDHVHDLVWQSRQDVMELSPVRQRTLQNATRQVFSLDDRDAAEEDDGEAEEARERVTTFRAHVRELLSVLTDCQAVIVSLRLGLDGEPKTQREISNIFGLTRGAIAMAEAEAIRKLEAAAGRTGGTTEARRREGSHSGYAALFTLLEASRILVRDERGVPSAIPRRADGEEV